MKYLLAFALAFSFALAPLTSPAAPRYIITSTSPTACTSIAAPAQEVLAVINAATAAQTVTLSLYDEAASPTCASADLVYSVVLGASQAVPFPVLFQNEMWLQYGLAYKLSAAATNNIVVLYR